MLLSITVKRTTASSAECRGSPETARWCQLLVWPGSSLLQPDQLERLCEVLCFLSGLIGNIKGQWEEAIPCKNNDYQYHTSNRFFSLWPNLINLTLWLWLNFKQFSCEAMLCNNEQLWVLMRLILAKANASITNTQLWMRVESQIHLWDDWVPHSLMPLLHNTTVLQYAYAVNGPQIYPDTVLTTGKQLVSCTSGCSLVLRPMTLSLLFICTQLSLFTVSVYLL